MKRAILVGCGTVAIALGSLSVATPASADGCPYGTVATKFPGVCTAGQGGGAPAQVVVPPSAGGSGANISSSPGSGFSTVDGIPCTPKNYGTCLALSQNGG
ncbi:MAG: hypothetical protein QOC63_3081 [Mycobacterium sp.]|jgi:hypothetical protein|nr:hypothetical protein [Mycobacterium sp.]